MSLTVIGKSVYGVAYALDSALPFGIPDVSALNYGDTIRDNGGNGMCLCVNECSDCGAKYLNSTLIFVAARGPCCARKDRS